MNEIKDKWRKIRKNYNLSQPQLAKALNTTQAAISLIESGRTKNPSVDLVHRLLVSFPDINPNWLMNDEGKMLKSETLNDSNSRPKDEFTLPERFQNDPMLIEYEKRMRSISNGLKKEIKKLEQDKEFFQKLVQAPK
tara:strand:+ start:3546 stop:3956 length:411 start_codon:yes stop_codon:yes gene_type:complete